MKQGNPFEKGGMLSLIGNSPMIPLHKYFAAAPFRVYAKLEMFNPTGSIKDRAVRGMLYNAWSRGLIDKDSTIIESSSGNTGVAMAQICAYLGLKFICVVDVYSQVMNRSIIEAFGGKIEMVKKPHPEKGFLGARLERLEYLLKTIPNSFNCDQYRNIEHPLAHRQTVQEILTGLGDAPEFIFVALSTCGTIKGLSETIRALGLDTKIIAVDAEGSVIFGRQPKKRLIPGHGSSIVPPFYADGICDQFVHVSDIDCISGCRRFARSEGLLIGGSSGGVVAAVQKYAPQIPAGATCVLILADRGSRYLDSIYSDEWVIKNFGQTPAIESYRQRTEPLFT
jgi:cysteine synthase A